MAIKDLLLKLLFFILIPTLILGNNNDRDQLNFENPRDLLNLLIKRKPGCNLDGLKIVAKDLSRTNLSGIRMRNGILLKVDLSNSNLTDADLQGTNFHGSILIGAKFKGASLDNAQSLHTAIYKKCANFPWSWLPWWEYDKESLSIDQLINALSNGTVVCQRNYTDEEKARIFKPEN